MEISSVMTPAIEISEASSASFHSVHGCYELWVIVRDGRLIFQKALRCDLRNRPEWVALLRKEYLLGMKLDHPNIIKFFGFNETDYCGSCIEMEYFDGVTLSDILMSRANLGWSKKSRKELLLQLAQGIKYLHDKRVIHRDLKPDNLLVNLEKGQLKIIDFGNGDAADMLINKHVEGPEIYGAPELSDSAPGSEKSDIWAFGKIMEEVMERPTSLSRKCQQTEAQRRPDANYLISALAKSNVSKLLIISLLSVVAIALVAIFAAIFSNKTSDADNDQTPSDVSAVEAVTPVETTIAEYNHPSPTPQQKHSSLDTAASHSDIINNYLTEAITRGKEIIDSFGPLAMPEDPFEDISAANIFVVNKNQRANAIEALKGNLEDNLVSAGYNEIEIEQALSAFDRRINLILQTIDAQ